MSLTGDEIDLERGRRKKNQRDRAGVAIHERMTGEAGREK